VARHEPVSVVEVRIWAQRVGAVALDPRLGFYAFEYDPAWIRNGIELAPRAMPLDAASTPFIFTDLPTATYRRLPAMLADSLPDEFGNRLIDAWLADQGVPHADITALDRLAYMGRRAVGALEFRPEYASVHPPTALVMSDLVEQARLAVAGRIDRADAAGAALQQLIDVGTSAGGARAKAAIAWNAATGEIRSGQFEAEPGFEHWLLKFDGLGSDGELGTGGDYGRIEYAYHLMAAAARVDMEPCRLMEEGGRAHFMTQRFDRDGEDKHHLQTLCALAHMDYKQRATHSYMQYFQLIEELELGYEAMSQGFRRMVFNVFARNCDDHSKNFSFLLKRGEGWSLAPAYDVTFAHNPSGEWTDRHQMSVAGRFDDIGAAQLLDDASRIGLGDAAQIIDEVADAVGSWPEFAMRAGLPSELSARIAAQHQLP